MAHIFSMNNMKNFSNTEYYYTIGMSMNQLVQTWSFSRVLFCKTPEWAYKFKTLEDAKNKLNYFRDNAKNVNKGLHIIQFKQTISYDIVDEIN